MNKNWVIKSSGNEEAITSLTKDLGIERSLAQLLVQRNITTYKEAKDFFRPDLSNLHDPFLMKNMDVAIQRILGAIQAGEKVLIYGDYDVDGTTAVALVYSYFKDHFKGSDYYIPDRYDEGYGISLKGIDYAVEHGFTLIIALDCGIKAVDKVDYANEKGVEFIICDHHNPGEKIPNAVAVLDPKQEGCPYPYKELSGCGVGLKLVQAYGIKTGLDPNKIYDYLDLVVVSIASDIVPITGENRVMAHFGLKKLNNNPSIGMKAIKEVAGIEKKSLDIEDIIYKIGPRINAAGRMESGKKSVDLLVCEKVENAKAISQTINNFNLDRRNIDTEITRQAIEMIQGDVSLKEKNSTVLYNPEWHKGVIGIVASRLLDHFYRPTVVLTRSNGMVTGSARSVNGFDLYKAIESCSDLLVNFGGHKYAAGLTMKVKNLQCFRERFEQVVTDNIDPDQLIPVVEIDTELQLTEITHKFFRILKQFQPFGPENTSPVFLSENVVDNGYGRTVGANGEHLKLTLIQEENPFKVFPAIGFHRGSDFAKVNKGVPFDICYQLMENDFRGRVDLQIHLLDMKFD
ncbi:MAG: single-stranded-DNA-specific exonuclease RecJ [Desulfobacterium sp. 4572_20]|nr:MAG: single-stranded-DNA-specific exonuclease RecJ [Desulfobacterium sp. 4572_20]